MKKLIATLAIASTMTMAIATPAQATTYYSTKLADANGKKYNMTLKGTNVRKQVTTIDTLWAGANIGDVVYNGTFRFYLNGKKASYSTNVSYNKSRKNFYKVSTKKGTPSLFVVSDIVASDAAYADIYYVYKGKLKRFKPQVFTALNIKYVKKNVIKFATYDNSSDTRFGYTAYYAKINPKNGNIHVFKSKYTGQKRPY